MQNYNDAHRNKIKLAWEHFIDCKDYDYSVVRPEILSSWERSRNHNVDPFKIKSIIYSEADIQKIINDHDFLIKMVRPYMEQIFSIVRDSGFYIMLCNSDGIILDLLGDASIIEEARKGSNLVVGANRSESFAGTNAIGTCLAMKKPIQIWSEEHYMKPHKKYSCSGGPIFAADGKLLGCLNLTGLDTEVHTHTLGMVLCAVDGISKELQIRSAYSDIEEIHTQTNIILDSVDSGFIILDEENQVIQISELSKKMLGIKTDITGQNFFDYFTIDGDNHNVTRFSELQYQLISDEINYYAKNTSLPPVKLITTVKFHTRHGHRNIVIKLDESSRINKITTKVSGFKAHFTFDNIIGSSAETSETIALSKKGARSKSNILILGESGTGKELIAQSIHNASPYANGPFVAINCAALPNGLIESELFGYESGAFTGARKDGSPGKFELANEGTIFLDEIGDMPLDVQASLLRVIQTREVTRIGAKYSKKMNVRIIAATNSDLAKAIENKTFREDLFYRLNVITIKITPLRDRKADICQLADYFLRLKSAALGTNPTFDSNVYPMLSSYSWPGNVRELENAIERALNLAVGDTIKVEDFHDYISEIAPVQCIPLPVAVQSSGLSIKENGKKMILASLEQTDGNVKKAADLLGISRRTLYRKLEKYNIDYSQFRSL